MVMAAVAGGVYRPCRKSFENSMTSVRERTTALVHHVMAVPLRDFPNLTPHRLKNVLTEDTSNAIFRLLILLFSFNEPSCVGGFASRSCLFKRGIDLALITPVLCFNPARFFAVVTFFFLSYDKYRWHVLSVREEGG